MAEGSRTVLATGDDVGNDATIEIRVGLDGTVSIVVWNRSMPQQAFLTPRQAVQLAYELLRVTL